MKLSNTGRGVWFGAGMLTGMILAEQLYAFFIYLTDLIQALDFALS